MSVFNSCRLLLAACLMAGRALSGEEAVEERFRDPVAPGGPSVALRLEPTPGRADDAWVRQLERVRELGAGGVLVSLPAADESVWGLLKAAGAWCRKNRIELGIVDFQSLEEASSDPRLQTLVWSSRQVEGAALATNLMPWVYGPGASYRPVACLAVPDAASAGPNQVVDLSKGVPAGGGLWRVFWFGQTDRVPGLFDFYQDKVVVRHLNQGLVALQNRLGTSYGTAFLWYQCRGVGASELVWPSDMDAAFLKQSGMNLTRHLPALTGWPLGGEAAAEHVRRQAAAVLREAWRSRYAANVDDSVQESGLEAGIAIDEAPVEPDEVALHFRRPTLAVARDAEHRLRNVRAAGAARALARRFIIGRLAPCEAAATPASPLLPFPFKHEMDGLFGDGATRILLELGRENLGDDKVFVRIRQACRYARRCQLLLQHGEPVADVLVWTRQPPRALETLACDYASQRMIEDAAVKGGRLLLGSDRSYGALAVSADVLSEPTAERVARQLSAKGLGVWLLDGRPGEAEGESRFCKVLEKPEDLGLAPDFVWRSEEPDMRVRFLHRRSVDKEIYFVMNARSCDGVVACTFRDVGKGEAERWDPLSGEIGIAQEVERRPDGRVTVPVYLGPHDACFIVFDR